jgi:WD40 repeat protein
MKYMYCLALLGFILLFSACSENSSAALSSSSYSQFSTIALVDADLSTDGKLSALLDVEQNLSIWHNNTQELVKKWSPSVFKQPQYHVVLSNNNEVIATASKFYVSVFTVKTGEKIASWKIKGFDENAQITSVLLNNVGDKVFIGLNEGSIIVADLNHDSRSVFQVHSTTVNHLQLLNNGETMLSGSFDSHVVKWNIYTGKAHWQVKQRFRITSLAIDENKQKVFISDALKNQQVVNLDNGTLLTKLDYLQRFRSFRKAIFIDKRNTILAASSKSQLSLWDVKTGKELKTGDIRAYTFGSTVLDFSSNEKGDVLSLSSDGILEKWPENLFD